MAVPQDPRKPRPKPPAAGDSTLGGGTMDDAAQASDFTVIEHGHGIPASKPLPKNPAKPPVRLVAKPRDATLGGPSLEKAADDAATKGTARPAKPGATLGGPSMAKAAGSRPPSRPSTGDATPATKGGGSRPRAMAVPDEVGKALPSARFDKYVCIKKLGAGGMGEVWKAWDTELNRWVALKFLKGGDDDQIARFKREAQLAGKLSHPHIAAIYAVGEAQKRHFIAMQFVDGQTLRTLPRNDRKLTARLVRDAARAVTAAHELGIIHRDIKPENLMVSDIGGSLHLFVMDFGLARPTEGSDVSLAGQIVGTPAFMAPEQARGEEVDERGDVWSLGASLYELLTDKRPFNGNNVMGILKRVQDDDPLPPRKIISRIDPDLETIVLKCLEKDRERRYATAGELADDLERFLEGEPIQAVAASGLYLLRKRLAKRKGIVIAGLLGAVGIVVAIAVLLPMLGKAEQRADTAKTEAEQHKKETGKAQALALDQLRQTTEASLAAALGFRQVGRYEEMKKFAAQTGEACRKAIGEFPSLAEPHYRLGRMHRAVMNDEAALAEQEKALAKEPLFAHSRYERVVLTSRLYASHVNKLVEEAKQKLGRELARNRRGPPPDLRWDVIAGRDSHAVALRDRIQSDVKFLEKPGAIAEAESLCAQGFSAWINRDEPGAKRQLMAAIAKDAGLEEAFETLAFLEWENGRAPEALKVLDTAVEKDRGYIPHLETRGRVLMDLHYWHAQRGEPSRPDLDRAIRDFTDVLQKAPDRWQVLLWRGGCHVNLATDEIRHLKDPAAETDLAIRDYQAALKLQPRSEEGYRGRGQARGNLASWKSENGQDPTADFEAAFVDLDAAIKLNDKRAHTWLMRAIMQGAFADSLDAKGRVDGGDRYRLALEDYGKALELDPTMSIARSKRATCRINRGMHVAAKGGDPDPFYREAIQDLEDAMRQDPGDAASLMEMARAQEQTGQHRRKRGADPTEYFEKALVNFTEALRALPGNDEVLYLRASTLMSWGNGLQESGGDPVPRYKAALEDCTAALKLNPRNIDALRLRGQCRHNWYQYVAKRGEDGEEMLRDAIADYTEAMKLNAADVRLWESRGDGYGLLANLTQRRGKDPSQFYRLGIEDYDRTLKLDDTQGRRFLYRGGLKTYFARYKKAHAQDPTPEYAGALEDFERAIRLDSSLETILSGYIAEAKKFLNK